MTILGRSILGRSILGRSILGRSILERLFAVKRRMYRGDRPGRLARLLNRIDVVHFATGLAPGPAAVLEVRGRTSGRTISLPVAVADLDAERYLVSMLGDNANWVRNVRAADGEAVLRRRRREPVRLVEVEPARRAPILQRYLAVAPGARPHVEVSKDAPLAAFEDVAGRYPVFHVVGRR